MSIVPKETIEVVAQSIGIPNLSPDVFEALAPDVEYRIREIMQEAIKCMRHARRTILMADDVDGALKLRNVEPIYGFASGDPLRFKRAAGHKDLFYIDDKDVEFKDVIEANLPTAPLDTSIMSHWLAVEGVQPTIPENAPVESTNYKKSEPTDDGLPVDMRLPIEHFVSKELQLYFEKVTELCIKKPGSSLFRKALLSLATDSGLHPLVPYFSVFIADEVGRNLQNFSVLFALMRFTQSLLQNPHVYVEPYLHQLMPSISTCLVSRRLGSRLSDNHWELRNFAAKLISSICKRFGQVYHNLQPRLTRTLLHAFLDPSRTLAQHYGAIQGMATLGSNMVHSLILPNLASYLQFLELDMQLESQKNETKRYEAWRVYGALLRAAGRCLYDQLKKPSCLISPPNSVVWKNTGRIAGANLNKRKASSDNLMQQPPLKKTATDNPLGVMPMNSLPNDMQGAAGLSSVVGGSEVGLSSMPRQVSNEFSRSGSDFCGKLIKTSNVLAQAWKEDIDGGNMVEPLFEIFGCSLRSSNARGASSARAIQKPIPRQKGAAVENCRELVVQVSNIVECG